MEPSSQPPNGTTTIPSAPSPSKPSPDAAAPPPPKNAPPNPTRLQKLRFLIRRALLLSTHTADTHLTHLTRLLSTPTNTDALLCTLQYTLSLLHSLTSNLLTRRLASLATSIADKASDALLPGETLITSFPAPTSTRLLAQTTATIKPLADLIADFRIFVRLWGLSGIYSWGRGLWFSPLGTAAGKEEKWLRKIAWGQVISCALFQVLENGAYLASKGILNTKGWSGEEGAKRQMRWWVWSSRFWAAHVVLEGARLGVLWRRGREVGREEGEEKEEKMKRKGEEREWWRDAVSNIGYAPLTLHYSVEEGIVGEAWVGFFGVIAGGALLADGWRATA